MILGLDLATSTGICYGDGASIPVVYAKRMPSTGKDVGAFLVDFWMHLDPLLEKIKPRVVVFEAPIFPAAKVDKETGELLTGAQNIHTMRKLMGLAGLVEMACAFRAIDCREVALSTVKKELGGHGRASKADMMFAARRAGIELAEGDEAEDEADAFGVWLTGIRNHAPQHSLEWDRRIYGGVRRR